MTHFDNVEEHIEAAQTKTPRFLLASIVHDFNNLLSPIVSVLEELQGRKFGTSRQMKKIDGAIYCAFRAKILARQLMEFANPRQVQSAAVDIGQLLEMIEAPLASMLSPDIRLELDVAEQLPAAYVDQELIERALLNLVLNARDAMPCGGEVIIAAALEYSPGSHRKAPISMIRVSVADSGIGMSDATLGMVGQPNFSTKTNGTGLGLATVKQVMESQGGGLSISSAPRCGTRVDLWLPVMPAYLCD